MIRHEIFPDTPHPRIISIAARTLSENGIILYPTDTLYGIGCSVYRKKAIERLYRIKGKSKFEPMTLLCESIQQASSFARISNRNFRILKRCLPGPYTFILEASREIPKLMLSRRKEIGIRIPDSVLCRQLIQESGEPLLSTSAGFVHSESVAGDLHIEDVDLNQIDLFLDAGVISDQRVSTVVRLIDDEIEILREGKGDLLPVYY